MGIHKLTFKCKEKIANVNFHCLYRKQHIRIIYNVHVHIEEKGDEIMINENIKHFRNTRGMSQEEMAVKLNVVRQTVSKWEKGVSQTKRY